MAKKIDLEDLLPLTQILKEEINALISLRTARHVMTAG